MTSIVARLAAVSRRISYTVAGAALAAGAPLGLLLIRAGGRWPGDPGGVRRELTTDPVTYAYVTLSTLVVFALFGYVLGRHADALVVLSRTDPLTRLWNALAFEDRLEEEVSRAHRYGEPLSLLLVDVDDLKAINDGRGHQAGDLGLQAVARALHDGGRRADLPARIGGDEFAVIAPSTSGPAAAALGERIRSRVVAQGIERLTISVGVATLGPGRALGARDLRETADAALYDAKRQGKNRVVAA